MNDVVIPPFQLDAKRSRKVIEAIGFILPIRFLLPLGVKRLVAYVHEIPNAQQVEKVKPYCVYTSCIAGRADRRYNIKKLRTASLPIISSSASRYSTIG